MMKAIVLGVRRSWTQAILLPSRERVRLRLGESGVAVPAETIEFIQMKSWRYAGEVRMRGVSTKHKLDIPTLGLTPLKLEGQGTWDPRKEFWGDPPLPRYLQRIIDVGPRQSFELEEILPGANEVRGTDAEFHFDPVMDAVDLYGQGEDEKANDILMKLLEIDLRCLDAHAHLGWAAFEHSADLARRHYEAGVRIGDLSLGKGFDGILPWYRINNRPFLRCLSGYAWSLWRLRRFGEALRAFKRILWLNPIDNQGVRELTARVMAGRYWADSWREYYDEVD